MKDERQVIDSPDSVEIMLGIMDFCIIMSPFCLGAILYYCF